MSEYWCNSFAWTLVGLGAGIAIGNLIWSPSRKELRMSIRSNVRLRDVVFGTIVALLGIYTLAQGAHSRAADEEQRRCLSGYIQANSDTSAVRSGLVADESEATREIVRGVFAAKSEADALKAYRKYTRELSRIDKARAANPVIQFDRSLCE